MFKGIDVSDNQGVINWNQVNVDFAILRSVKRNGKADTQFANNVDGCRKNNIPFDVYKYTYALTPVAAEVEALAVVDLLSDYDIHCTVWWDVEDAILRGISRGALTEAILAAKSVIERNGYKFGVYTGLSFYKEQVFNTALIDAPFWIARYPNTKYYGIKDEIPADKYIPQINHDLVAWQYTSKGKVEGINTVVDLNVAWSKFWESGAKQESYYGLPSITSTFSANGIPHTFADRKKIATANGLKDYKGTVEENMYLIALLIQGKLRTI